MRKYTEGLEVVPDTLKPLSGLRHTPEHSALPEGTRPERQFATQERGYCTKGMESLES